MSSTKKIEVACPTASFPIVDLKDYDVAEKTIHYIHVNHITEKPKLVNAEEEENFKNAEFTFMVGLKNLIHKVLVDLKLSQSENCLRTNQEERALEYLSLASSELTKRVGSLFAGEKNVMPQESEKQVVDALHFGYSGSTKMLAESNIFCWTGMRKDKQENCSTCTACMRSREKLTYHLPMTKKSVYRY